MIYIYAFVDRPDDQLDLLGLEDRPIWFIAHRQVAAVVSDHTSSRIEPTLENIYRHEQVIEQTMQQHAVLPARFGSTLASEHAVEALLASVYDKLSAGLQRVAGLVEVGVRVLCVSEQPNDENGHAPVGDTSGLQYLQAKSAAEQRRRDLLQKAQPVARSIHTSLAQLALDATFSAAKTDDTVFAGAYLVPRAEIGRFSRQAKRLAEPHRQLRMLCTGPWPVYHFAPDLSGEPVRNA
jgi:hypothetical protein